MVVVVVIRVDMKLLMLTMHGDTNIITDSQIVWLSNIVMIAITCRFEEKSNMGKMDVMLVFEIMKWYVQCGYCLIHH